MPSGGDESPPPPPPAPAAASSEEEEEDEGEAGGAAPPALSPTPQTQQRFEELCCRLNMDETARAEAWDSYRSMSQSYTLEVRLRGVGGTGEAGGEGLSGPSGRARRGNGAPAGPGSGAAHLLSHGLCSPQSRTPGFRKAPGGPEGDSRTPALPFGGPNGKHLLP